MRYVQLSILCGHTYKKQSQRNISKIFLVELRKSRCTLAILKMSCNIYWSWSLFRSIYAISYSPVSSCLSFRVMLETQRTNNIQMKQGTTRNKQLSSIKPDNRSKSYCKFKSITTQYDLWNLKQNHRKKLNHFYLNGLLSWCWGNQRN